jgi:hypothetical protein
VATERSCISYSKRNARQLAGPGGDTDSFQTVLADLSRNLVVKLLDFVPLFNPIDVFLARKSFAKHFPHLHASLDVEHQLGDFVLFQRFGRGVSEQIVRTGIYEHLAEHGYGIIGIDYGAPPVSPAMVRNESVVS